ncbi:hypothetical protein A2875_02885 [Candidatus Gottesmanbacteria bacterium RIFCSPHIGHO2_01_FULL_46_14]|uniref:Rieske domain-containing protein n=3 Tax=Microgenomates group TaxID=1794810 RepID=A0A1F5ZPQ1_9BACT|nr:MAG: Ferredoxin subunit of nitrite reductase and ring-hydroxylating dioxygenase [Candidatus Curtissbacteria bacterium GW2011_GWA1_41_11]OGG14449.1 MAG: hypothetical protein A2875_02885 [Candidatus Gottesmanbacteria bacterium RIFCSPHIGHO2_01_FULL_46_14]OGG28534.1 MAG: hypothetical protein A2971_03550 [Candidatus Gottesmanbacteria bacterium RIFCSPLOWO2_01_FULL_46_21]
MDFVKVISKGDLPAGSMKTFMVGNKPVAIANVDGEYFAVSDICTHEHCSLGTEGFLDGSVITCGCHGGQFDVTTGKVLALPPPADVSSYEVKVEGDDVLIKM